VAQHSSAGHRGPRRPWVRAWLAGHRSTAAVLGALVAAAVASAIVAAGGGTGAGTPGPGARPIGGTTSAPITPAPEASVMAADNWLTGPADKVLGSLNADVVNVSKALRAGERGTEARAGRQLAAAAKAALDGPMPPVDAALYRSALADLDKAGTDTAAGQPGAVGSLLIAGTTDITKVTAAADLVAPAGPSGPVPEPNG
jgi:hypothetical protein